MQKSNAIKFIILLGVVSLFADITYEGSKSIIGAYLSILKASGATVGIIIGLSEIAGYVLRGIFGYISDKTKQYWLMTIIGYVINLSAVPLLATTNSWVTAGFFIILERLGKAIRVPPRDAMLSYATKQIGRGLGFGIHEALDQIGAIIGPLAITILLFFKESYRFGFAILAIPAAFSIIILFITRFNYPKPEKMEKQYTNSKFDKKYWLYILAVGLFAMGFVNFTLISFHFQKASFSPIWIPFFYSIAMGVDGLSALIMGKLFDSKGIKVLALATLISAFFAPLVFQGNFQLIFIGMIFWGIGMGSQESIMRSVVPSLAPPDKRASAYGMLNMSFGLFWALGSVIMGFFYDTSIIYLVIFSIVLQLASIPIFLFIGANKDLNHKKI
ncbi:MAG: MFS transporter [Parachlamydiales bacterium]|jgi:MFS family permease